MIARLILTAVMLAGAFAGVFAGCWWIFPPAALIFTGLVAFVIAVGLMLAVEQKDKRQKP